MTVKAIRAALKGSGFSVRGGFIREDEFAVWPTKKSGRTWGLCGNLRGGVWRVSRCGVVTGRAFADFQGCFEEGLSDTIKAGLRGY